MVVGGGDERREGWRKREKVRGKNEQGNEIRNLIISTVLQKSINMI